MKIDIKPKELIFGDLNVGDSFYGAGGRLMIKMETIFDEHSDPHNCIGLEDGHVWHFKDDHPAQPARVKIVEDF